MAIQPGVGLLGQLLGAGPLPPEIPAYMNNPTPAAQTPRCTHSDTAFCRITGTVLVQKGDLATFSTLFPTSVPLLGSTHWVIHHGLAQALLFFWAMPIEFASLVESVVIVEDGSGPGVFCSLEMEHFMSLESMDDINFTGEGARPLHFSEDERAVQTFLKSALEPVLHHQRVRSGGVRLRFMSNLTGICRAPDVLEELRRRNVPGARGPTFKDQYREELKVDNFWKELMGEEVERPQRLIEELSKDRGFANPKAQTPKAAPAIKQTKRKRATAKGIQHLKNLKSVSSAPLGKALLTNIPSDKPGAQRAWSASPHNQGRRRDREEEPDREATNRPLTCHREGGRFEPYHDVERFRSLRYEAAKRTFKFTGPRRDSAQFLKPLNPDTPPVQTGMATPKPKENPGQDTSSRATLGSVDAQNADLILQSRTTLAPSLQNNEHVYEPSGSSKAKAAEEDEVENVEPDVHFEPVVRLTEGRDQDERGARGANIQDERQAVQRLWCDSYRSTNPSSECSFNSNSLPSHLSALRLTSQGSSPFDTPPSLPPRGPRPHQLSNSSTPGRTITTTAASGSGSSSATSRRSQVAVDAEARFKCAVQDTVAAF
ncbi:uncharacterized protein BDZ99DRAFT_514121 [Mytilinidion resinicola]|uniref:Uncharacterized protein n=1 Tax=Mytilinidion resinicola TaxID=574789 RepID=A0A6A6ZB27_9PEZI|nr:uncharacterized protein BDZ99DRAFT_514121 [Mytilinidion resinicola]KAF2817899.1 hypothetical protein BDZ99DRAFT_514121 [Mytilinidion resinicola]